MQFEMISIQNSGWRMLCSFCDLLNNNLVFYRIISKMGETNSNTKVQFFFKRLHFHVSSHSNNIDVNEIQNVLNKQMSKKRDRKLLPKREKCFESATNMEALYNLIFLYELLLIEKDKTR